MKNFKYQFAVKVSNEEQNEIVPELIELEYEMKAPSRDNDRYAILASGGKESKNKLIMINNIISGWSINLKDCYNISTYNKDLILAIAAMVDDDIFHIGELLEDSCHYSEWKRCYNNEITFNQRRFAIYAGDFIKVDWYKKATLSEICKYFGYRLEGKDIIPNVVKLRDDCVYNNPFGCIVNDTILNINCKDCTNCKSFKPKNEEFILPDKYEKFILPEKWCVKFDSNNPDDKVIATWFNTQSKNTCYPLRTWYHHRYNNYNSDITKKGSHQASFANPCMKKGYSLITREQFKQYVLNKNTTKEKEIIGYKCPMDLFCGKVKSGEIYDKTSGSGFSMYGKNCSYAIAIEIVKTWEPVYKQTEIKMMFGTLEFTLNMQDKTASANGESRVELQQFKRIYEYLHPSESIMAGYKCSIIDSEVKVCNCIGKLSEIKSIIDAFDE